MKSWMKILIYVSLIFVVITIIKGDYFNIPEIVSYPYLILSFLSLSIAFLLDAKVWKDLLKKYDVEISFLQSYVGMSVPIFSKYIPGKIWSVVGRASYTANIGNFSKVTSSTAALFWQLLALLTGTLIGLTSLIPYLQNPNFQIWILLLVGLLTLLLFVVFSPKFIQVLNRVINKFVKKSIQLSHVSNSEKLKLLPSFILMWLFFSLGFFFMIKSIDVTPINLLVGTSFTLGSTLGILAIIAPGGIGVREGILVAFLVGIQFDIAAATTIAISSRIWFLIAELLVFISGLILRKNKY